MHIVFLCGDTTQFADANLAICHNLAKEFSSRGHSVSILGSSEAKETLRKEQIDGITYYRFFYPINGIYKQIMDAYNADRSKLRLALGLLMHPVTACINIVRIVTGYNQIEQLYTKLLRKVDSDQPVDLAIACGSPYYAIHALARSRIGCKRIGYMLDPYWKNQVYHGKYAKREELYAWKRLDRMVVPSLLARDYEDPAFSRYIQKRNVAEYPGIDQSPEMSAGITFDPEKCNLLFAGNLYQGIRSPEYLLEVLDQMQGDVCLHMLGGVYGQLGEKVETLMTRLVSVGKLKLHGSVPVEQARAAMRQADILVNIGNCVDNQLPSKILEYFSTGKPVLHIQKLENCPCLPYMRRYQNALVLKENSDARNLRKVKAFCMGSRKELSFDQVRECFPECTIPYVADLFLEP